MCVYVYIFALYIYIFTLVQCPLHDPKKSDRTIRHGWLRLLVATHVAVLKEVFFFAILEKCGVWCV